MVRREHIGLVARHYVKHSLRGGAGLVFIFLGLVAGLICAQVVIGAVEMAQQTGVSSEEMIGASERVVGYLSSMSSEQVAYLTRSKPAVISGFLAVLFLITPAMAILGGFNQLSGDIGSKGLRYLVQRTERSNLFFGRLIGAYVQALLVFALVFAIVTLYVIAKIKLYPAGDVVLWMLGGYLRMAVLLLPYLALCAWISAAIDAPFGALTVGLVVIGFVPILAWFAGRSNETAGTVIGFLMPGGFKWWLLHPSVPTILGGVAVMLGFTAAFTWLGWRHFENRDL